MWTSVPQMALLRIRTSTSWTPTSGIGASRTIQIPSAGCDLTRAFMRCGSPGERGSWTVARDDPERAADPRERLDGEVEVLAGVGGAHLRPDAGRAVGHHREE